VKSKKESKHYHKQGIGNINFIEILGWSHQRCKEMPILVPKSRLLFIQQAPSQEKEKWRRRINK